MCRFGFLYPSVSCLLAEQAIERQILFPFRVARVQCYDVIMPQSPEAEFNLSDGSDDEDMTSAPRVEIDLS